MLAPSVNRLFVGILLLALLVGCGSSGAPKPAEESVRVVVAEPAPATEETLEAESSGRESRRARRARERSSSEEESREQAPEPYDQETPVPDRALTAHERAAAAMARGDWLEAELELEQLVLEFSGFPGPYVNLAIVYRQDGRQADARNALEQAIAIDPAHAPANNELGIALREEGDFAAAERAYRRAIESDPGYELAYYNLGVLLDLYMGRQSEALGLYEAYQGLLSEPDPQVNGWIIDLRRRLGVSGQAARTGEGS